MRRTTPPSPSTFYLTLSLAFLLWAFGAAAQQAVPTLTGRVVDEADILSPNTERTLTTLLTEHEQETSNQVAVLTIPSLEGEPIEAYSIRVAEAWGLGTEERDNGVLLTVAVDDRRMRIEVGYGLEGVLPDAIASRIIRHELRPHFRKGDFDAGVLAGVQAILGSIEGTYEPPARSSSSEEAPPLLMRLLFALMFIAMPLFFLVPTYMLAGRVGGLVFAGLFIVSGSFVLFFSAAGVLGTLLVYVGGLVIAELAFRRLDNWKAIREKVQKVLKENKGNKVDVDLGFFTLTAGGFTTGGGSGSSSGGFSSGGGGFSGGGGSFGGGGASGGW